MRKFLSATLVALAFLAFAPQPCPAQALDLNGDGVFDTKDILLLISLMQSKDPEADVNGDGRVDYLDLFTPSAAFGDPVPTPTPPATPTPEPTVTPTPDSGARNVRDYWPMVAVGDFWFMKGEENVGAVPDDFRREITSITASGIEFFTSTTTNDQTELQEFRDVFTAMGDLGIKEVGIDKPIPDIPVPTQTIPINPPLIIVAESVDAGWTDTTSTTVTIQTGLSFPFPPTVQGTLTLTARVVAFDTPVTVTPNAGAPVNYADTLTIEYQSTVTIPGFVNNEFFKPLSARLTLARGVGPVELQEFVDTNSIGEIFRLKDGQVNGQPIP